jgi:spore maturation protein CgeB
MVKKIRLIEEEPTFDEMSARDFQDKTLEYMKSIDWKLWEMMKVVQKWAEREGLTDEAQTSSVKVTPKRQKSDVKPIIVDEDEDE